MATALAEEVKDFITCQTCLLIYNEDCRKPKFLPCSCTLCVECIKVKKLSILIVEADLFTYSSFLDIQDLMRAHSLSCPICLEIFFLVSEDANDLPDNSYAICMLKMNKSFDINGEEKSATMFVK